MSLQHGQGSEARERIVVDDVDAVMVKVPWVREED